jgi:serine/threonine-protein kinase
MVLNVNAKDAADRRNAAADAPAGATTAPPATGEPAETPKSDTPEPPAKAQNTTYAGKVTGGKATIAIAVKDGKAVAYLCDGNKTEAWLQGTAVDGELDLRGAGKAALRGSYTDGRAEGEVAAGGQSWTFAAKAVKKPSGLYRATANVRNANTVVGWIDIEGAQTGIANIGGQAGPAPRLDTTTGTAVVDGVTVTARPLDGSGL